MSSHSRRSVVALVAFAGLACGQGTEGQVAPVVTPPPVVAPPKIEPATAPAPAKLQGFSAAKVPEDAPRFVVVARAEAREDNRMLALLETTDGQPFLAAGPMLLRLTGDGSFETEPSWLRGLAADRYDLEAFEAGMLWWNAVALGGSWPEPVYLVTELLSSSRAGGEPPELYKRTGGAWARIETRKGRLAWYPRSFGPWKDGSLLALKGFVPTYEDDLEEGPSRKDVRAYKAALAEEKRLIVLRGEPKAPAFGERDVVAFASLASGQIWAVIEEGGKPSLLYFDGTSERMQALPGAERGTLGELGLRATAADRVWAFGRRTTEEATSGYLARFDGTAWTEIETGCAGDVVSLSIDADGVPYFICTMVNGERSQAVLLRWRGGVVEELPTEVAPGKVIARKADDIWVLTEHGEPPQLLHSGSTRAQPFDLPSSIEVARSVFEWADPQPELCNRMWIPLAAGSDRAAVERTIAGFTGDDYEVAVVDARVQGRVEAGVLIRTYGGTKERMILSLLAKLGAQLAEPTCNQRPPVEGQG